MNIDWKLILKIFLILIGSYFIIKWAVRKAIKEAFRSITGFPTFEDIELYEELHKDEFEENFYDEPYEDIDIIEILTEDQIEEAERKKSKNKNKKKSKN